MPGSRWLLCGTFPRSRRSAASRCDPASFFASTSCDRATTSPEVVAPSADVVIPSASPRRLLEKSSRRLLLSRPCRGVGSTGSRTVRGECIATSKEAVLGAAIKGRRKIMVDGEQFLWSIHEEDVNTLHVVSRDKRLNLRFGWQHANRRANPSSMSWASASSAFRHLGLGACSGAWLARPSFVAFASHGSHTHSMGSGAQGARRLQGPAAWLLYASDHGSTLERRYPDLLRNTRPGADV